MFKDCIKGYPYCCSSLSTHPLTVTPTTTTHPPSPTMSLPFSYFTPPNIPLLIPPLQDCPNSTLGVLFTYPHMHLAHISMSFRDSAWSNELLQHSCILHNCTQLSRSSKICRLTRNLFPPRDPQWNVARMLNMQIMVDHAGCIVMALYNKEIGLSAHWSMPTKLAFWASHIICIWPIFFQTLPVHISGQMSCVNDNCIRSIALSGTHCKYGLLS